MVAAPPRSSPADSAGSGPLLVLGNLDCETRWHGAVLPRRVLGRISAAATLLRYLFDEPIALWTPAPVDPRRLLPLPGAAPLELRTSEALPTASASRAAAWGAFHDRPATTAAIATAGAAPRDRHRVSLPAPVAIARAVNDRRFAAALAESLGLAPPGAAIISSLDELRRHLAAGGAAASPTEQWICKAPLSAAGRDRVLGQGAELSGEPERALARLLQRFTALTFEPWLDRTCDLGVCAVVRPDAADGSAVLEQRPPHSLLTTARGGFCGISQAPPLLNEPQRDQLSRTVLAAGHALRAAGYFGPYNLDAFIHRDRRGELQLRALCEINARLSFGWIAAALSERYGLGELGFSPPPDGATVLVAADDDGVAAWARPLPANLASP